MVVNNQYLYFSERTYVKQGVMELDTLDAILTQNKAISQQINAITQHLSRIQVSAVSAQHTSYDMSVGFLQGENFGYGQFTPEQVNFMGQKEGESLYESWEMYKLMLKKYPPDMFSN